MSYQAFFEQTEAVAKVLDEWVHEFDTAGPEFTMGDADDAMLPNERFTALWQAVELLSRAYTVLMPMVQLEGARLALNLPDVQEKKGTLYGPDGQAL